METDESDNGSDSGSDVSSCRDELPELGEQSDSDSDSEETHGDDNDAAQGPVCCQRPLPGEKRSYHAAARGARQEKGPSRLMESRLNTHQIALRFQKMGRVIKCCNNNCLQQIHDAAGPPALFEAVQKKSEYIYSKDQNSAADTLLNELKLGYKTAQTTNPADYTWGRVDGVAEKSKQEYWWRPATLGTADAGECYRVSETFCCHAFLIWCWTELTAICVRQRVLTKRV